MCNIILKIPKKLLIILNNKLFLKLPEKIHKKIVVYLNKTIRFLLLIASIVDCTKASFSSLPQRLKTQTTIQDKIIQSIGTVLCGYTVGLELYRTAFQKLDMFRLTNKN